MVSIKVTAPAPPRTSLRIRHVGYRHVHGARQRKAYAPSNCIAVPAVWIVDGRAEMRDVENENWTDRCDVQLVQDQVERPLGVRHLGASLRQDFPRSAVARPDRLSSSMAPKCVAIEDDAAIRSREADSTSPTANRQLLTQRLDPRRTRRPRTRSGVDLPLW